MNRIESFIIVIVGELATRKNEQTGISSYIYSTIYLYIIVHDSLCWIKIVAKTNSEKNYRLS